MTQKFLYVPRIDMSPFKELDNFALLACQKYNFGNETDWFGCFRGGLYGFYGRFQGITENFRMLHEWMPPRLHIGVNTEHHLASIFFNMDSAIECLTFALNALGFAAQSNGFRDVTNEKSLSKIAPKDVMGNTALNPPLTPLKGYLHKFPSLQSYWNVNRQLLSKVIELHDVSKHREAIYTGGKIRSDPPPGFFKMLGFDDDKELMQFSPHEEILLKDKPKAARKNRKPVARKDFDTLEDLVPTFVDFLQNTGVLASNDSRANIELQYSEFREAT